MTAAAEGLENSIEEAPIRSREERQTSGRASVPEDGVLSGEETFAEREARLLGARLAQAAAHKPNGAREERVSEDAGRREREARRRAEILDAVQREYRVDANAYYFRDRDTLAFRDTGTRVVTALNDERVAFAMAALAEAKGWKSIKVAGHPDFRREVWLEANLRGIGVSGFTPSEQDLRALEERRERLQRNAVERVVTREERQLGALAMEPGPAGVGSEAKPAATREAPMRERAVAPSSSRRVFEGRLVEHGPAPYEHDPEEKESYFVKLDLGGSRGIRTIWGIDLKRGLGEAKAQPGDALRLEYVGRKLVTVVANVRDGAGKVVGRTLKETPRNTWRVEKGERERVVAAVAQAVVAQKIRGPAAVAAVLRGVERRLEARAQEGRVPTVLVYDKRAPPRAQPRVEGHVMRHGERTR